MTAAGFIAMRDQAANLARASLQIRSHTVSQSAGDAAASEGRRIIIRPLAIKTEDGLYSDNNNK
jgi:hypothetical protein